MKGPEVSDAVAAAFVRMDFARRDSLSTWSGKAVLIVNNVELEARRVGRNKARIVYGTFSHDARTPNMVNRPRIFVRYDGRPFFSSTTS